MNKVRINSMLVFALSIGMLATGLPGAAASAAGKPKMPSLPKMSDSAVATSGPEIPLVSAPTVSGKSKVNQ